MLTKTFADKAIDFFEDLEFNYPLPPGVEVMNPYSNQLVMHNVRKFFAEYFSDNNQRIFIWGINPGRFGAGVTGIAFTDPVALRQFCNIENESGNKRELSSRFIYDLIEKFGGVKEFYARFFFTALSPLGFLKNEINYNYYDDPQLMKAVTPFIVDNINAQIKFGAIRKHAICLGTGKNFKYFNQINKEHAFFENIHPVDHPRFIMQYRLKTKDNYIQKYLDLFQKVLD